MFSQNGGRLGYKYLFRMKYHYSPLECMPSFFSHKVYLRDKSRSFFAHWTIFCKKCLYKQCFLKNGGMLGYKYLFRMKDDYSPLECVELFLVIICICVTNHVLFLLTGRYFVKNAYICNFFSKWRNAGV